MFLVQKISSILQNTNRLFVLHLNGISKLVQVRNNNISSYQTKTVMNSRHQNQHVACIEDFLCFATCKPIVYFTSERTPQAHYARNHRNQFNPNLRHFTIFSATGQDTFITPENNVKIICLI